MRYTFDPAKAASNAAKHGVEFSAADEFEWETARVKFDMRRNYEEERMVATGFIGARLHVLVYTERGDELRIISLRKANHKEVQDYENQP